MNKILKRVSGISKLKKNNSSSLFVKRKGLYFGQCSEICGVNHGFMPIVVKVVSKYDFKLWQVGKLMSFDV